MGARPVGETRASWDLESAIEVVLDSYEMRQAAQAGVERHIESVSNGRRDRYGMSDVFGWQHHIEGAMGELAVAKVLDLYWNYGVNVFKGPDVGDLQVRTTHRDTGNLLLHEADSPTARYVLVTGINGHYVVRGWISGWVGKQRKYWGEPQPGRPCYMVPQSALMPIGKLLEGKNE